LICPFMTLGSGTYCSISSVMKPTHSLMIVLVTKSIVGNWNAADAIPWFVADFEKQHKWIAPLKGFETLILQLETKFLKKGGETRLLHHRAVGRRVVDYCAEWNRLSGSRCVMEKVMLRVEYSILASHSFSSVRMTCSVLERFGQNGFWFTREQHLDAIHVHVAAPTARAPKWRASPGHSSGMFHQQT